MKEVVTSHGTGRWLLLGLCLSIAPVMAQSDVRGYPDPGHRWLGVYAGGPERHFDYFLRKISLGDTFPDKAAWWEALKKARSAKDDAHRHDVYIIYCGEKQGDLESAGAGSTPGCNPNRTAPRFRS